ncbi:S1C family serine protease [Dolosigranulum pigrum]|uniref:S1C family serine protease n=1 Tax=Dolosigranulum pigrum TaxID=29394 RepID=UPI000DC581A5|nr:trypsin-like peptidase domain-containing protein [Dolosigranulum pigrum]QTJ42431.1 PDZ domain-containing protein [Dolosigranulum pigrum]QTJ45824.1 PDZ domain-containing protein [Dolosigranulum pigrum]QTJ49139.1 PDZ domain-containing protein [Dolosigranulum pigrum]QTJ59341.1 PDZ domain-containing protein [Dolosigranulum pigrum]RAN52910.1 peptidase S1 [Dolosigranulum pigrum]
MTKRLKHILMISTATIALVACQPQSNQATIEETEPTEQSAKDLESATDETKTSTVKTNVESDITEAVKKVQHTVVTIINKQQVTDIFGQTPTHSPDGELTDEDLNEAGTGSGAIYKVKDGKAYIFTNNHVVEGSDAIDVMLKDGSRVPADVIGADKYTDLAVLSIDAENVTDVAEFGDSDNLTLGEPAIAIGSPLGTEFPLSVTAGIVSGVNRMVPVDTDGDRQMDWQMNAIQTDAAINPGNSGGPLVNVAGQIIGINSMKISTNVVEGMGFAIPSNDAVDIINELEREGEIVRPTLGITMVDLGLVSDEQKSNVLKIDESVQEGVVVVDVTSNTSASEAGLQSGDVITSFNGQPVTTGLELRQALYKTRVGDEVDVEFYREGQLQTQTMTMREQERLAF